MHFYGVKLIVNYPIRKYLCQSIAPNENCPTCEVGLLKEVMFCGMCPFGLQLTQRLTNSTKFTTFLILDFQHTFIAFLVLTIALIIHSTLNITVECMQYGSNNDVVNSSAYKKFLEKV